jgi:hypothetical protein
MMLCLSVTALGQSAAQQPAGENLAQRVENPIEFLTSLKLENKYSPSLWGIRDTNNEVEAVFMLPFIAFRRENLTRIKLFYETSTPSGERGLSELELLQLVLFTRGSKGWGIGASLRANADDNDGGTLAIGPAIGAKVKHGKWTFGFLNQNFFGHTLSRTQLQPILGYTFNKKWSASLGDVQYTYNWSKDRATSIPLSGQLSHILSLEQQPIQLLFRAQYNLKQERGSDKWNLTAGFAILVK